MCGRERERKSNVSVSLRCACSRALYLKKSFEKKHIEQKREQKSTSTTHTNLSRSPVPSDFNHLQLIFNQRQRLQRTLAVDAVVIFALDLKVEARVSRWF